MQHMHSHFLPDNGQVCEAGATMSAGTVVSLSGGKVVPCTWSASEGGGLAPFGVLFWDVDEGEAARVTRNGIVQVLLAPGESVAAGDLAQADGQYAAAYGGTPADTVYHLGTVTTGSEAHASDVFVRCTIDLNIRPSDVGGN